MNAGPTRAGDYLGIPGYVPRFQRGVRTVAASHATRLLDLVGRRLEHTWLAWDADDDTWVVDAPVILQFDGAQLEIQHQKFDELSLTWGDIDPAESNRFSGSDWSWRDDATDWVSDLGGRTVVAAELLEWCGQDMAHGMVAVGITLHGGRRITVRNGLDENGIDLGEPGAAYRSFPLVG